MGNCLMQSAFLFFMTILSCCTNNQRSGITPEDAIRVANELRLIEVRIIEGVSNHERLILSEATSVINNQAASLEKIRVAGIWVFDDKQSWIGERHNSSSDTVMIAVLKTNGKTIGAISYKIGGSHDILSEKIVKEYQFTEEWEYIDISGARKRARGRT